MKVISGGQTGVDQAGLDAAKFHGIETGGWMPGRWTTLNGPKPGYAEKYGMVEHKSVGYAPRTKQNIFDSDATLIIAGDFSSPTIADQLEGLQISFGANNLRQGQLFSFQVSRGGTNPADTFAGDITILDIGFFGKFYI